MLYIHVLYYIHIFCLKYQVNNAPQIIWYLDKQSCINYSATLAYNLDTLQNVLKASRTHTSHVVYMVYDKVSCCQNSKQRHFNIRRSTIQTWLTRLDKTT